MTEKNKTDVIIDGRKFIVVGDEDEEYILHLAKYVDNNIRNLSIKNSLLSQTMSATLAALNITDELFKTKMELEDLDKKSREALEDYENLKIQLRDSNQEIERLKSQCRNYKEIIESLEDKNFQNQIEIVEIKKELKEYIKLLESETDSQ